MKQKILYIITFIIALIITLSVKTYATETATVNTETLNLRKEASTDSDIVELLNMNTKLEIIEKSGDWYKVKHGENTGYVKKDYIDLNQESSPEEENEKTETTTVETATTSIEAGKSQIKSDTEIKILPVISSNTIANIKAGEDIIIITKTNKWGFIQKDDIAGWVTISSLEEKQEQTSEQEPEEKQNQPQEEPQDESTKETIYEQTSTKYVNSTSVYVRKEPTTESDIVTTLIKNTDVIIVGENDNWYKIKYNNLSGYIRKDLLSDEKLEATSRSENFERTMEKTISNNELGQQIVDYAKQYLGCPYVYGGSGSSSFDCSGFTMYVYKQFGYELSHSATAQSKRGEYVSKENLQPGDLVFFLDYETMDGIGHCGIYIGDGDFIHASSGTGYCVKISTLLSGSYSKRYATARRLI